MGSKNRRFCDYKDCGLPENNNSFLVQSFYMAIVFVIMIKDLEKATVLNMILFAAPGAIDVLCFKHSKKIQWIFKCIFVTAIALFGFLAAMVIWGVLQDSGTYYVIADTFPLIGSRVFSKWFLICLAASMIGVPFLMFFARPNKDQVKALALREEALKGE